MKMNITFDEYEFSKPVKITKWEPPESRGLYAILVPDLSVEGLPLRAVYFGQTENFAERGFPKSHHKFEDWVKEAMEIDHLFIAIYSMPGSTREERESIESKLINLYHPVCND